MATVTQLLDRGVQLTGLKSTGNERDLALQALQDTYIDTLLQTECTELLHTTVFTASQRDYTLGELGFANKPLKLKNIIYAEAQTAQYPLMNVSEGEINEYRRGYESTAYTRLYANRGTNSLAFWPKPQISTTMTFRYVPLPPELSETEDAVLEMIWDHNQWDNGDWDVPEGGGIESTPSLVPVQFHWNVLLPGMIVQMLDKDQRIDDVRFWIQRYEAGLEKMKLWVGTFGGEPPPVFDPGSAKFMLYPDQRGWH